MSQSSKFGKLTFALVISATLMLGTSCKSTKSTTTSVKKVSPETLVEALERNTYPVEWFSGNDKIKYADDKQSQNFTANIRFRHDSLSWTSCTGPLGVEAVRVLASPDSVKILDKLKKHYYAKSFHFIAEYLPFPFQLVSLENIILGQPLIQPEGKMRSVVDGDQHLLIMEEKMVRTWIWLNPITFNITRLKMEDRKTQNQLNITFEDYEEIEGKTFSNKRQILFIGEHNVRMDLEFNRVKFNQPAGFPFGISAKYERKQ